MAGSETLKSGLIITVLFFAIQNFNKHGLIGALIPVVVGFVLYMIMFGFQKNKTSVKAPKAENKLPATTTRDDFKFDKSKWNEEQEMEFENNLARNIAKNLGISSGHDETTKNK